MAQSCRPVYPRGCSSHIHHKTRAAAPRRKWVFSTAISGFWLPSQGCVWRSWFTLQLRSRRWNAAWMDHLNQRTDEPNMNLHERTELTEQKDFRSKDAHTHGFPGGKGFPCLQELPLLSLKWWLLEFWLHDQIGALPLTCTASRPTFIDLALEYKLFSLQRTTDKMKNLLTKKNSGLVFSFNQGKRPERSSSA